MSPEENTALARRFLTALVQGDLETMDEVMAPDYVSHTPFLPEQEPGRDGVLWAIGLVSEAVSNAGVSFEVQFSADEMVVTRFVAHYTHDRGELMGVPPSGRQMTNTVVAIHRIVAGKIAEEWSMGTMGWEMRGEHLERERIERARVEQKIGVARRIQRASLPEEVPEPEGWAISPVYRPAREVGGDFYDFHLLDDGRLGLVLGDATGKGVPAALIMSTTCGMLQLAARSVDSSSPGEVLARVNEALIARIPPNTFVTCFYATLDPKSGSLSYANAGHDVPYLRRRNGEVEELRARGMPLGLMPGMRYEEKEVTLDPGEGVLFYSDGVVEAHDPEGEMFGFPRLRALVGTHLQAGSLWDHFLEELYSFVGEGWEQEDDITLLALERSALRSRA